MELFTNQRSIEHTKVKVLKTLTRCIEDIEKTVAKSGHSMRDVGIEVKKFKAAGDSYIIDLRLRM
jgi:hypothetical protein